MNIIFSTTAKWCHFTFTNVEVDFFSHLLKKMGSTHLNTVNWSEQALETTHVETESSPPII